MISAATIRSTQFSGIPDPLPPASPPSDYGEQSEHHQVQTGSTNNLATETVIDAISMAIPVFWEGASFSLVYMPSSLDAFFTLKFYMADGYR